MKNKRILSLILALCLVFCAMPVAAFAEASAGTGTETMQLPSERDLKLQICSFKKLSDEDRARIASGLYRTERPQLTAHTEDTGDPLIFDDIDESVDYLRSQLALRSDAVSIGYYVENLTQELLESIFYYTIEKVFEHTGVGNQGDYLLYHARSYGAKNINYDPGQGTLYLTYTFTFYTDAQQEKAVAAEVASVLDSLDLEGKNEYEKFYAIYEYITHNIVYDFDHLGDTEYLLQFTAYAAIINKTAVCQGYANLLYRMLLEAGLDCRIISGEGNGGGHAWNIVRLGEYYYNVDSTWDASGISVYDWEGNFLYKEYPMTYMLRCNANFPDHIREARFETDEFNEAYPMSDKDFDPDELPPDTGETDIKIDDFTGGSASVTVEDDVVTVVSSVPLKIGCLMEDGSIAAIAAEAVDGRAGTYTFTVEDPSAAEIVLVVAGDVDLSGEFDFFDVVTAKAMDLYPENGITALQAFAGDVDSDGEFGFFDVILIKAADLGKSPFEW